jgi:NAD+ diphosphatase
VVIAAVLSRDRHRCLLGRNKQFPPGFYSCLAGFIEPGETMEEAVRREVSEESSIRVGGVIYHSSQPWPFPSQLMLGCWAEALNEDIKIDPEELEDAKWFTKEEVAKALANSVDLAGPGLKVPPKYAIAHHLLKSWVDNSLPTVFSKY